MREYPIEFWRTLLPDFKSFFTAFWPGFVCLALYSTLFHQMLGLNLGLLEFWQW
jgi:hypothetical protein